LVLPTLHSNIVLGFEFAEKIELLFAIAKQLTEVNFSLDRKTIVMMEGE